MTKLKLSIYFIIVNSLCCFVAYCLMQSPYILIAFLALIWLPAQHHTVKLLYNYDNKN